MVVLHLVKHLINVFMIFINIVFMWLAKWAYVYRRGSIRQAWTQEDTYVAVQ